MKEHFESAVVYTLKDSIDYASGATVSKIVRKNKCGSTTLFSFDKGQTLSEHTAPFDAMAIILDGACEISNVDKAHRLSSGEMIIMPANVPHALEAIEAFKMMLVMMKSPKD